jgi:hypothetical protein
MCHCTTLQFFDTLIRPVLCNGFEVWGVDFGVQVRQCLEPGAAVRKKSDEHEVVHNDFIRRALQVCPTTPGATLYWGIASLVGLFKP